jgi:hypothetical protein
VKRWSGLQLAKGPEQHFSPGQPGVTDNVVRPWFEELKRLVADELIWESKSGVQARYLKLATLGRTTSADVVRN